MVSSERTSHINFEDKEFFDVLCIIMNSTGLGHVPKEPDVHLFSYLSCLLWIYSGKRVHDWGYSFVVGENGYPFSSSITKVISYLRRSQLLQMDESVEQSSDALQLSDLGMGELTVLLNIPSLSERRRYVDGATDAQLMIPIQKIIDAVRNDPAFGNRQKLSGTQSILEGPALRNVHEQLSVLHEEIGIDVGDLFVPATVWLQFYGYAAGSFSAE
jgi:hypothetical protein